MLLEVYGLCMAGILEPALQASSHTSPCSIVCEVHTLMKYVRTFNGVRIESLNVLKGDSEIGCSGALIKGPMASLIDPRCTGPYQETNDAISC